MKAHCTHYMHTFMHADACYHVIIRVSQDLTIHHLFEPDFGNIIPFNIIPFTYTAIILRLCDMKEQVNISMDFQATA